MIYTFDRFELDTERYELRTSGASIPLERQVFDVLSHLVRNHERVVTREELQDEIWGDRFVSEAAVSTRVMSARKAIGDNGRDQRLIKTVHGRGFRFVAEVQVSSPGPGTRETASPPAQRHRPDETPAPSIHYRRSTDGVNIACWTWGSGRRLVAMPDWIWSHIRSELRLPEVVNWYRELSARSQLVRYDGRGEGLSDREAPDFSLAGRVLDLEAVVGNDGPTAIFAHVSSTLTAMAFTAAHPEKVSHLVLWCGYSRAGEFGQTTQLRALTGLVHNDWDMFVENIARSRITGWASGMSTQALTRYLRDAATREYAEMSMESLAKLDVSEILGKITTPTLVIHCSGVTFPGIDASRNLAARIPNAELCILEGSAPIPHMGPIGPALKVLEEFMT